MKRRGAQRAGVLARGGRDDEVPVGLVALAVRLDVAAVAQVLVHELALAGGHRVERDRAAGAARASSAASSAWRSQHLRAALAVALGVDDDAPARGAVARRRPAAPGAARRRSSGRGGR